VRITATVRAVDMSDEQRNAEMLSNVQLHEVEEDNGYTTSSRSSRKGSSKSPKRTSTSSSTRKGVTTSPGESSAVAAARHNATAYEGGRHAYRYLCVFIMSFLFLLSTLCVQQSCGTMQ
jgi:hypothetical protein